MFSFSEAEEFGQLVENSVVFSVEAQIFRLG
jgi:hypothetical protein